MSKRRAVESIKEINRGLKRHAREVQDLEYDLKEIRPYMIYIREYIPEEFGVHDYLVDLALMSSESGYVLKTFTPVFSTNTGQERASVYFEGEGKVYDLVASIENMKRLTEIQNLNVSFLGEVGVRMSILIYTIK
jgi:hypothetical protein